jgi:hypothetical protein
MPAGHQYQGVIGGLGILLEEVLGESSRGMRDAEGLDEITTDSVGRQDQDVAVMQRYN